MTINKGLKTYLWLWVFLRPITPHWEWPSYLSCPGDHKRASYINVSGNKRYSSALHFMAYLMHSVLEGTVACVWPLTWQAGCHEEGATWFGGPWFSVSAGVFSATSSPFGPWGLHTLLPSLCKDYKNNTMLIREQGKAAQDSAELCGKWKGNLKSPAQKWQNQWFSNNVEGCSTVR